MSTLKSSQQQKISLEARIYEILTSTFPDFQCSITDIKFPKKEFVVPFYSYILEELHISVPKITMGPMETQLQRESHPELYTETLPLVNLCQALRRLLSQFGDGIRLGLQDLVEPNVSRNSAFMFNLLNFFNFADSRVSELASKLDIIGQRKAELEKLLERREKLSREINQRAIIKAKRLDYSKEIKSKRAEMDEMQRENKSLEEFSEKKQMELDDIRRRYQRVQSDVSELKISLKKLEAQQVQSPDVLKSNLKHLQEKLEETKQQLEEMQQTGKEKRKAIELLETVEKDQDVRLALLADIVNEANSAKDLEKQHSNLQAKIKTEISETEAMQAGLNDLKTEHAHLSAQLTNLQLQWEKNKSSMKESIRHLAEENKMLELKQGKEMEDTMQAMEQVKTEINDLIEENNSFNKHCEELYAALNEKEQLFIAHKNAELDARITDLEKARKN